MSKIYVDKEFEIELNGSKKKVLCGSESTRNGFRHLLWDCDILEATRKNYNNKRCYLNRTWERYQYESLLSDYLFSDKNNKLSYEERQLILENNIKPSCVNYVLR